MELQLQMQRYILYIINEKAGTRAKKDLRSFIEKKTREQNISFEIVASVANGDYSFLDSVIREKHVTDIVIAGGDGTVNQVIHSLRAPQLNFGIIPCGSGNGLAFAAKIPKNAGKALDIVFANKAALTDAFTVNEHFSCMLSGIGFDAKVAHDFARQSKRGLLTYVKQIIKNFFSAKAWHFDIQLAGQSFPVDAFFISIANSNQFGNNFTIAPKASLQDGLLDIVVLTSQNKLAFLLHTLLQAWGRYPVQTGAIANTDKAVLYFRAEKLIIHNPSLAPLHIDGEPAETAAQFDILVKKEYFKLLRR